MKNNLLVFGIKDKIYNRILELSKNNAIVTKMVEGLKRDNTLDKAINKANAEKYKLIANSKFLNSYHRDDSVNDKKAPEKFDWEKAKDEAVKAAKKD